MKRIIHTVLVLTGMVFFSCLSSTENTQVQTEHSSKWLKQIEYAKNFDWPQSRGGQSIISLESYSYKGKIESQNEIDELIKKLFSDDQSIVQYTGINTFEIVPLKDVMEIARLSGQDGIFDDLKEQLANTLAVGMDLIELEWNFNGEKYYSTAIASNDLGGIFYDHIGHYMVVDIDTTSINDGHLYDSVLTRNSDDQELKLFKKPYTERNIFGVILIDYYIYVYSWFSKSTGILVNKDINCRNYAGFGCSCRADAQTIRGVIDVDKYHEFAWAWAFAKLGKVSLTFNGFGFDISGGGTGESGTEVHRLYY